MTERELFAAEATVVLGDDGVSWRIAYRDETVVVLQRLADGALQTVWMKPHDENPKEHHTL